MHLYQALPVRLALSLLLSSIGATTNAYAQIDIGIGGLSVGIGGGGVSVETGGGDGGGGVSLGVGGSDGLNVGLGTEGLDLDPGLGIDLDANYQGDDNGSGGAGGDAGVALSQEQTLDAVRKKRAVPLAPIVTSIKQANVEVIDAQLLSVRGILVYQLRVIGEGGSVSELYFYARTGKQVLPD
jgi:hypothetical protein